MVVSLLAAAFVASNANASQIVSTSTGTNIRLGVNSKGEAMVTYTAAGRTWHVLAWGALNANAPTAGKPQVAFTLQYDGGYKKYYKENPAVAGVLANLRGLQSKMNAATAAKNNPRRWALAPKIASDYATLSRLRTAATDYWTTFTCPKYDGPKVAWLVVACKAPDGSYWAVQQWQRGLPSYGVAPTPAEAAEEVHLSHWTGALPLLTVSTGWAWRKWDELFGTFAYEGSPVYGTQGSKASARRVYVDTLDSAYGTGWRRENGFLTHSGTGAFCYSVNPHGSHPAGNGTQYRATIMGPGVTPDVMWQGPSPGPYDPASAVTANAALTALGDTSCRPH